MTEIKQQPTILKVKYVQAGGVSTTEKRSPDFGKDKIVFARRFWNKVYVRTEGAGCTAKSILFETNPPLPDDVFSQLVGSEIKLT